MKNHKLDVYLNQILTDQLSIDRHGDMSFVYGDYYLKNKKNLPLSHSLPVQKAPYSTNQCRPFFSGLLPEAHMRTAIARQLGISEKNDFALLAAIGNSGPRPSLHHIRRLGFSLTIKQTTAIPVEPCHFILCLIIKSTIFVLKMSDQAQLFKFTSICPLSRVKNLNSMMMLCAGEGWGEGRSGMLIENVTKTTTNIEETTWKR